MTAPHETIDEDEFAWTAPPFDHDAIRTHVQMLHELAHLANVDGKLVLAIFAEDPTTGRKITETVRHFKIGDADGMTADVLAFKHHPYANIYALFAIMRSDLPLGKKGGEADVRCVLALVGDLDADTGKFGALPLPAPYVVETSPGNAQAVYPLSTALPAREAKPIAEALAAAIGCDAGTKALAHVWRVPGTLNWPNAKKLKRGRSPEPQPVTVVTPWAGEMVEPERLKEAVAAHSKPNGKANGHDHAGGGAAGDDWRLLWTLLPEAIKKLITAPALPGEDRSAIAATVILSLIGRGWNDAKIAAVIRAHPQGIGARYAEGNNLEADIQRLRGKSEQPDGNSNTSSHAQSETYPPRSLEEVHSVFEQYLGKEYDMATLDAVLAVTAAERLGGDPAWLLVISGPGNAKTETVQSISAVSGTHITSTIASEGALLSATPKKGRGGSATGGLLRKIGDRGLLIIKDVTSILSMDRNVRSTVLAALREIHDGKWERNVGTDGGRTLSWEGRIVVIGACTTAWDQAHGVIASMGDRFVTIRSNSNTGRLAAGTRAIRNAGIEAAMRKEIAEVVAGVINHVDSGQDYALTDDEIDDILHAANIVTLARTGVETDYRGDIIDAHAPEMPTRFAKQLSAIMRGGVAIGMHGTVPWLSPCAAPGIRSRNCASTY